MPPAFLTQESGGGFSENEIGIYRITLPFGEGGPLAVGEVRIRPKFWVNGGKYRPSSVKNRRFLTPSPEGKVRACGAKENDKLKFAIFEQIDLPDLGRFFLLIWERCAIIT